MAIIAKNNNSKTNKLFNIKSRRLKKYAENGSKGLKSGAFERNAMRMKITVKNIISNGISEYLKKQMVILYYPFGSTEIN